MKLSNLLFSVLSLSALSLAPWARGATSTVSEDNGATSNGFGNQSVWHQAPTVEHPAIITTGGGAPGAGWDFSSSLASLQSGISHIDLTLTLQDGNSAGGLSPDFDFNHLFFYVGGSRDATTGVYTGGINTGLALNGFRGAFTDTITLSLDINPATTGAAILTQLNANAGRLSGFIVSDNTGDTAPNGNQIFVGNSNLPSNATTSLTLSAVPEPATWALVSAGMLMLLSPQVRRLRKSI